MSERSRKLLIALAALLVGVTSACKTPSPESPKPTSGGGSGGVHPFMPKDTPIIIADDGTNGPLVKNGGAAGIYVQDALGTKWTGDASTGYVFTLSLNASIWLIADGSYEYLDPTTATSFDVGKQTVSFNLNASTPSVTVTPRDTAKDVCNIDASDMTKLHCNGKIHGNKDSVGGKNHSHSSASDDGTHDYFLFIPQ